MRERHARGTVRAAGDMIRPTTPSPTLWERLRPAPYRQLELPLEGVPSARLAELRGAAAEFAFGFAPRLGAKLLMRFGVPMVGAMTPVAIGALAPHVQDDWRVNLAVGSGLGGAWGAAVGAVLPFRDSGERIPRLRSAGMGAAAGVVMAPAVAAVSKYAVDWLTSPIRERPRERDGEPG